MTSRYVVTGAAGFLGSHLTDRIIAEGHSVVAVDNFVTGSADNLAHLKTESRFDLLERDLTEPVSISGPIDGILHFASPASPVDYLRLPLETLKVGAMGTMSLLDLACAHDAPFLLASTSEVYGDPLVHPQSERYWGNVNPVGPRAVYDESKRFAEALTMAYRNSRSADTRIVRIFNTYGPRMRPHDGRVISNFVVQALRGDPLTVYGDGSQSRSFCYVSDLVEGIWRLFNSGEPGPVNLGNPEEYTIRDIAEMVLAEIRSPSEIEWHALPTEDPVRRCPDITLAEERLGWTPLVSLEDGLRKTVAYFEALRERGELGPAQALVGA